MKIIGSNQNRLRINTGEEREAAELVQHFVSVDISSVVLLAWFGLVSHLTGEREGII
jgi:hypothetical protein